MSDTNDLALNFERHRDHLRSVARRMLGSDGQADDAVQDAWLRIAQSDVSEVHSLRNWLTTIVARLCLDRLRARQRRLERPLDVEAEAISDNIDLERETLLADSIGAAMLVVLDTLAPAERVAFVLHDLFDIQFDQIAPIIGRSPAATRQIASRARRRFTGASTELAADRDRHRGIVAAFVAASRNGDFEALLALLDPDVVLDVDGVAIAAATKASGGRAPLTPEARGASIVARTLLSQSRAIRNVFDLGAVALVNNEPSLVFASSGSAKVIFDFSVENDRIVAISIAADQQIISQWTIGDA